MGSRRPLAIAAALAVAACGAEQGLPAPAPASVDPAEGYTAHDVEVLIRGEHFHLAAEQDVEGCSGDRVLEAFRAWLGEVELVGVTWVDGETLAATVPAGLPAGRHALVVEAPGGARGALADAYLAVATPPPGIVLEATATPCVAVGEVVEIRAVVTNVGLTVVEGVSLKLKRVVNRAASENVPPDPPDVDLAAGQSSEHVWTYPATRPGVLEFEARAGGVDPSSGLRITAAKARAVAEVHEATETRCGAP
jgi:hypothetical protein